MATRDIVTLTETERARRLTLSTQGPVSAHQLSRAQTLLQAAGGATDAAIATALHLGIATVERRRQRCVEAGLEAAVTERARPGGRRKLAGRPEACLIARACRTPPEGQQCGTRQRLAATRVDLRVSEAISEATVRRTRKNRPSSHGRKNAGVVPR
jgi:hypothetical protein